MAEEEGHPPIDVNGWDYVMVFASGKNDSQQKVDLVAERFVFAAVSFLETF